MSHHTSTTARTGVSRGLLLGAGAGVLAAIAMAMYAMGASWAKDTGFLTPLYHIASLWLPQDAMMSSMEQGMAGDPVTVRVGPALVGALIHLLTGAGYGALFGALVARLDVGGAVLTGLGAAWGLLVFVVSAFVALPAAAAVFGSGDQISDMASMAGWGTFVAEHVLFGLVLGLVLAARSRRPARVGAAA